MQRKLKRQQRTIGAIVKIPLLDGFHSYARILKSKLAFYNLYTTENLSVNEIITKDILFFASVYDSAITKGYWLKVAKKLPIEKELENIPPFYRQDILNPTKYIIYKNGTEQLATREECLGLECWAIWNYDNIEERLNNHFTGRKTEFVEYMHNADIASYFNKKRQNKTASDKKDTKKAA